MLQRWVGAGAVAAAVAGLSGCSDEGADASQAGAGGTGATAGAGGDDAGGASAAPSWEALDAWLKSAVEQSKIRGFAVQIFDADDRLMFESQAGVCAEPGTCPAGSPPFTVDLVTGTASSSKWVTSTVTLAALENAVRAGKYPNLEAALDQRVDSQLSCAGVDTVRAGITLRQLLSFTSGLRPDVACIGRNTSNLQDCACSVLSESTAAAVDAPTAGTAKRNAQPPGTTYKYGEGHHVVVGAMMEKLSGLAWPALYSGLIGTKLGIDGRYADATLLSGSYRSSVADYARFVRAVFHDGRDGAGTLLSREAVLAQQADQMPDGVVELITPQPGVPYGLNNWRWCLRRFTDEELLTGKVDGSFLDPSCTATHQTGHGGKGGWSPFIDVNRGYYGVFAMREPSSGGGADYGSVELDVTQFVKLYSARVVDAER